MVRKMFGLLLMLGALVTVCGRVEAAEKGARTAAAYTKLAEMCSKFVEVCQREQAASRQPGADDVRRSVASLCGKIVRVPYMKSITTDPNLDFMCFTSIKEIMDLAYEVDAALKDRPDFKQTYAMWEPGFSDAVSELFYAVREALGQGDGAASAIRTKRRNFDALHGVAPARP